MSTPTVPVTVDLAAMGGPALAGITVRATLDGNEVYTGIVVAKRVEAVTDASGVAILNLFPNAPAPTGLGTQGTTYRFSASVPGGRGLNVDARVPNLACRLENILVLDEVGPLSAAELALLQAQAAVPVATAQAAAAAASAAAADADATQTAADRVQTGLDRVATAADRVQTGLDRTQTGADRSAASASANAAASSEAQAAAIVLGAEAPWQLTNYAALRAYVGGAKTVQVTGYLVTAAPSGIAGQFTRDDSDTTSADNGGTIIVASNGKRWKRQLVGNTVTPRQFGCVADGTTVDDTRFDAALAYCEASGVTLDLEGFSYKLNTAKTVDVAKFSVVGGGAKLDVGGVVGYAFTIAITNTVVGSDAPVWHIAKRKWEGFELVGARLTGHHCFKFGDGTKYAAQFIMRGIAAHSFDRIAEWSNHAYVNRFESCQFYDANDVVYYPAGLTNSGERITFVNCDLFNSTRLVNLLGGGYVHAIGCSLDYFSDYAVSAAGGGQFLGTDCFIESNSDGDYWFKTADAISSIRFVNPSLIVTGNRTKELGYASHASGGIYLDGPYVSTSGTYANECWFKGYVYVDRPRAYDQDVTRMRPWVDQNNLLVDGGFESTADGLSEWDLQELAGGSEAPSLDAVTFRSGAKSLKFSTSAVGKNCAVVRRWAVSPGAKPTVVLYLKNNFLHAGDQFTVEVGYQSTLSPSSITAPTLLSTFSSGGTSYGTFTRVLVRPFSPAPPGATQFYVALRQNNAGGLSESWVDDIQVEVLDGVAQPLRRDFSTWVPTVKGSTSAGAGTYGVQVGRYERQGGLVHVFGTVSWSAHTGTGDLVINLPFKVRNWGNYVPVGTIAADGLTFTGQLALYGLTNTKTAQVCVVATGAARANVPMDTVATIFFELTYDAQAE